MTTDGSEARRRYWRSIDRLLDSPAVREAMASSPEFPDGADQPPDAVTRRTMMTLMGASFALAGLSGCRRPVEHIVPYVDAPEGIVPGIPRRYATAVPFAGAGYGAVVESHEGRPSKLEGNALHPASQGAANVWMQAAILDLCDPDRSPRHLRRGSGSLEPVAWEELAAELIALREGAAATGGAGWGVLVAGHASPTAARLVRQLGAALPAAEIATWEPASDANQVEGLRIATGAAALPRYRLDRARVVVALDADLLNTETDHLRLARDFAAARSPGSESMLRLYAVESTMTITGANADHRLRVKRAEVPSVLAALAAEAGVAVDAPPVAADVADRIQAMARDLVAAGAAGLVAVGRAQPPAVHALAHAVNHALGAVGTTVEPVPADGGGWSDPEALARLVRAMHDGELETLFVLGGNPAYDAPAELELGAALAKVATVVQLATQVNETTAFASHHITEATFLEAWGDVRAPDGTRSVVQPLIAPLLGGKSAIEMLALLASGAEQSGYDQVRERWSELIEEADFEAAWRRILHDGLYVPRPAAAPEPAVGIASVLAAASDSGSDDGGGTYTSSNAGKGAAPAAVDPAAAAAAFAALGSAAPELEVTFEVSRSLWDGRFANNAWLQELPDPITKVVWDNAALISPATARSRGLEAGDVIRVAVGERSVELPVWVLPGQADGSIALELGYGRRAAGRVGDGVGVDVYPLRTANGAWSAAAAVEKTGRRYDLVQTQEHGSLEGRPLYRETDAEGFRADPHFAADHHPLRMAQPFDEWDYGEGHQWGMAIDLGACIGCNACVVACQAENNIPVVGREQVDRGREMHWLRIDRYFTGGLDDPGVAMQPVPCMHCENAPCEQVCPVAATVHDDEGLNAMVYNRCIGTRYCSNNCPYKVRRFNFFNYTKDTPELMKLAMNPDVTVRSRGVMEKCSYCVQRISEAKIEAKRADRALRRDEIETACQQTCPTRAIVFGDLNDAGSEVAAWKGDPRNYVMLGDLNNRPRTSYLGRVKNPNPAWPGGGDA